MWAKYGVATAAIFAGSVSMTSLTVNADSSLAVSSDATITLAGHAPAGPVEPGEQFDWVFTITNNTQLTANVSVEFQFPADLRQVSPMVRTPSGEPDEPLLCFALAGPPMIEPTRESEAVSGGCELSMDEDEVLVMTFTMRVASDVTPGTELTGSVGGYETGGLTVVNTGGTLSLLVASPAVAERSVPQLDPAGSAPSTPATPPAEVASAGPTLPATGQSPPTGLIWAVGLIVAGFAMVKIGRRRTL